MDRSKTKKKRNQKLGNRFAIAMVILVVVVLAATITLRSSSLKKRDAELHQKALENQQLIEDEEARTEELNQHKKEVNTKQYIEKIAKEKLGLVNPDEIIIVPEE